MWVWNKTFSFPRIFNLTNIFDLATDQIHLLFLFYTYDAQKQKKKKVLSASTFYNVERFIQIRFASSIVFHDRQVNQNFLQKKVNSIILKLVSDA